MVAIGGSYAGSMAAWFRLKYPHLADMALASSAPMVAVADFKGQTNKKSENKNVTCTWNLDQELNVVIVKNIAENDVYIVV